MLKIYWGFYKWQKKEPYNFTKETNFIIYDIIEDNYKLREEEKLREGNIYFKEYDKKIGSILLNVSFKKDEEPLVTIKGLTSKSNIDLNQEIKFLLNKVEKSRKSCLRLIK